MAATRMSGLMVPLLAPLLLLVQPARAVWAMPAKAKLPSSAWSTSYDLELTLFSGFVWRRRPPVHVRPRDARCLGLGTFRRFPGSTDRYFRRFVCRATDRAGREYRISVLSVNAWGKGWRGVVALTAPSLPPVPVTLIFGGSGPTYLGPFSLPVDEHLCWTSSAPDGAAGGNQSGDFALYDDATGETLVDAHDTPNGCLPVAAGKHQLSIIDDDTWTIKISGD
jgi:hypothetical protein